MPRVDENGCPVSNMDELVCREENGELVYYDCRGDVAFRIPKTGARGREGMIDPFHDVPIESTTAWLMVEKIAHDAVYICGHPRGGCRNHCDRMVKIIEIARERLKAEANSPKDGAQ